MWVKVDDGFVEHPKVIAAARHLGPNGVGRVVAVWLEALCYAARNLTDGFVPIVIARKFITDRRPLDVLDVMAMADVRLMTKTDTGYRFHDFEHYQPSAAAVKEKRQRERERKSTKESARIPRGFRAESFAIPPGICRADSARIPERSRARDPVPSPRSKKEQCADAHRVLVKVAHTVLDDLNPDADSPPLSELSDRLKDRAAAARIPWRYARQIEQALASALVQRQRRAS